MKHNGITEGPSQLRTSNGPSWPKTGFLTIHHLITHCRLGKAGGRYGWVLEGVRECMNLCRVERSLRAALCLPETGRGRHAPERDEYEGERRNNDKKDNRNIEDTKRMWHRQNAGIARHT